MRSIRNPRLERGEVRIEDIALDHKCRDDLIAILIGIQYLYLQEDLRERLFALLDKYILPGTNRKVGRPGMDMWSILVLGLIKQGTNCDYDQLHSLVNYHSAIRQFLGHAVGDNHLYNYQTIKDNLSLLNPELLQEVNRLIVEIGHKVAGKKPDESLSGRYDSFVVETNVHYPTDVNLLSDSTRCMVREVSRTALAYGVSGWRQWKYWLKIVKRRFNKVRNTRRAKSEDVKAYLDCCAKLVHRVETCLPKLEKKGAPAWKINEINNFHAHAARQIDHVGRRLLKGETIPQDEKVFSIFEPHTRWISKGKAGCPVELGVPVCIMECEFRFVLHHEIMWKGSDVEFAVPMVKNTQAKFSDLRSASSDRGFHSSDTRKDLDERLDCNALPKKGRLSKADQEREQDETFVAMRRQHPAVESAINNLEQRGLDRVRAKGSDGFAQTVALAVVALNVHRLGRLVREKELGAKTRKRNRRAA